MSEPPYQPYVPPVPPVPAVAPGMPPPAEYASTAIGYQGYGVFDRDAEHLKVLSICWYVISAMALLGGCFPLIYVVMGLALVFAPALGPVVLAAPPPIPALAPPPVGVGPEAAPGVGPEAAPGIGPGAAPGGGAPAAAAGGPAMAVGAAAAPFPSAFGWIFAMMGAVGSLFFWTCAVLGLFAARALTRRRRLVLCYVAAAIACLQMPFGTVLGIFTFIVLARPSIRQTFV